MPSPVSNPAITCELGDGRQRRSPPLLRPPVAVGRPGWPGDRGRPAGRAVWWQRLVFGTQDSDSVRLLKTRVNAVLGTTLPGKVTVALLFPTLPSPP